MHVEVHVAQMKQRESVEARWQPGDWDFIVPQLYSERIAPTTPMKTQESQDHSNHRMRGVPILDVEEVPTLTKDSDFRGVLYAEALAQVKTTDPGGQRFVLRTRLGGMVHADSCKFRDRLIA